MLGGVVVDGVNVKMIRINKLEKEIRYLKEKLSSEEVNDVNEKYMTYYFNVIKGNKLKKLEIYKRHLEEYIRIKYEDPDQMRLELK